MILKRVRITQRGTLLPLAKELKDGGTNILQKLALQSDFALASADEMKKVIKEGKTFKTLRKSTVDIRTQRMAGQGLRRTTAHPVFGSSARKIPINKTTPLIETGSLLKSIKEVRGLVKMNPKTFEVQVSMWKYGLFQANGFVVSSDFRSMNAKDERVTRAGREFAKTLKSKEKEGFKLTKSEKAFVKRAGVKGKIVPPRDFITIASKGIAKYVIKEFRNNYPKMVRETMRPNIIVSDKESF